VPNAVRAAASDGHDVDVEVSWADDARGMVALDGTVVARRALRTVGANCGLGARRMRSRVRARVVRVVRVVRMIRGAIVKTVCG